MVLVSLGFGAWALKKEKASKASSWPLYHSGYLSEKGAAVTGKKWVRESLLDGGKKKCGPYKREVQFLEGRFQVKLPDACVSAVAKSQRVLNIRA